MSGGRSRASAAKTAGFILTKNRSTPNRPPKVHVKQKKKKQNRKKRKKKQKMPMKSEKDEKTKTAANIQLQIDGEVVTSWDIWEHSTVWIQFRRWSHKRWTFLKHFQQLHSSCFPTQFVLFCVCNSSSGALKINKSYKSFVGCGGNGSKSLLVPSFNSVSCLHHQRVSIFTFGP